MITIFFVYIKNLKIYDGFTDFNKYINDKKAN